MSNDKQKVKPINTILRKITFDDLREWAGETILNRGKSYVKRVDQLSRTQDNALIAWVTGSERYITSARVDEEGGFEYFCTCPYTWGPCKHAVAVILAAAEHVKRKETIPILDEDNDLSQALFGDSDEEDDEWEDDEPSRSPTPRRTKAQARVGKILGDKSREELLGLLIDLSGRFPNVRQHIVETEQLASGQVDKLVHALRSEIRNLTAEPAWYNHWRGEGNLPDYTHLAPNPLDIFQPFLVTLFILYRRQLIIETMTTLPVVKHLDVIKYFGSCLVPGRIDVSPNSLTLE